MIDMILGFLSLLILCVFVIVGLLALNENEAINSRTYYIYPKYHRRNDESYAAPYCSCGNKLYSNQKFCQECGAGILWNERKVDRL